MLNKVFLIGNLGQDPEVRHTNSGQPVANLRLATSRRVKDRDGNWSDQTEWHTVVCFSRTAELAGQYLHKGSKIFVEGRIQTRSWEDREGKKQYRTEVVCENLKFLDPRGGAGGGGYDSGNASGGGSQGNGGDDFGDDDIPF
ncbi:MAG TPA: single-stranded DNA-binding protein [Thermoanaerobaculia bacterium]|nr:single-stranded DNA-binding protein [Thermoanaerobaculia bacterium]